MKRIFTLLPLLLVLQLKAAEAADLKLRVAVYNIKGLPFPIQTNHTPRYKKIVNAIRTMKAQGNEPDVIMLQESFSLLTNYIYLNLRDTYPYRVRGPGNRIRWNSGLEILSKKPFSDANVVPYTACDSFDCLARKGVLHARVKFPEGEVDFYNTHMQANNDGRANTISEGVRVKQAQTLINFVNNTHDETKPMFMGGDFNAHYDAPSLSSILGVFGDIETKTYCQMSNACPGYTRFDQHYWDTKIDHILYEKGSAESTPLNYEIYFDGTEYSDHDMVMGTYLIKF